MPLSKTALAAWAFRIRYVLTPALTKSRGSTASILTPGVLDELHAFFRDAGEALMTVALLRQTKIHLALLEIAEPGAWWPDGLACRAEHLLGKWQTLVDEVQRSGLWGSEGHMHGITPINLSKPIIGRDWWLVEDAEAEKRALQTGHCGFGPGDWWVHPIAAYRDGIIGNPRPGLTATNERAYAVLIDYDEEVSMGNDASLEYQPHPERRWRTRLMCNQHPVRVLRPGRGGSGFDFEAGVRYEGLYHVNRWSVKLVFNGDRPGFHQYTFRMSRIALQSPPAILRLRPNIEDMAIHQAFTEDRAGQARNLRSGEANVMGVCLIWSESQPSIVVTCAAEDSGYSSEEKAAKPATLMRK